MVLLPVQVFSPTQALASGEYDALAERARATQAKDGTLGWSYVISGSLAIAGATPAFYLSKDVFAKSVFSIAQTLGVAAVGYGAYLVKVEGDDARFVHVLASVPSLTLRQKDELARGYFEVQAERAHQIRTIRVISHSLTAGLNFLNAATATQRDLQSALYFVAGVNTVAAIALAIRPSADENAKPLHRAGIESSIPVIAAAPTSSGTRAVWLGWHAAVDW